MSGFDVNPFGDPQENNPFAVSTVSYPNGPNLAILTKPLYHKFTTTSGQHMPIYLILGPRNYSSNESDN